MFTLYEKYINSPLHAGIVISVLDTEADKVKFCLQPELFCKPVDVSVDSSCAEVQFFSYFLITEAFITEFHKLNFGRRELFLTLFLPVHIILNCQRLLFPFFGISRIIKAVGSYFSFDNIFNDIAFFLAVISIRDF